MSPGSQVLDELVARALAEDVGDGDVTTQATVPADARAVATITQKAAGVVFGLDAAEATFRALDPGVVARAARARGAVARAAGAGAARDRQRPRAARRRAHGAELPAAPVGRRDADGALRGAPSRAPARRSSTRARRRRACVRWRRRRWRRAAASTTARACTTWCSSRRTTRRWRAAWGRRCAPRAAAYPDLPLEVECSSLEEVDEALAAGAQRILLDNMGPPELRAAVAHVAGRARLEASGGIGFDTLRAHAETGVDSISIGALTHSAPALDLSLLLETLP